MTQVKLTKTQLRLEQVRLATLRQFLPTLRLKKSLLQQEISEARVETAKWNQRVEALWKSFERLAPLFSTSRQNPLSMVAVGRLERTTENIAGIDVPHLAKLEIDVASYSTLDTPVWLDGVISELGEYRGAQARALVASERVAILEGELRLVSIRVNLFEKILIPRALGTIRKIRIFLGDQELTAIGRSKIAKRKRITAGV